MNETTAIVITYVVMIGAIVAVKTIARKRKINGFKKNLKVWNETNTFEMA